MKRREFVAGVAGAVSLSPVGPAAAGSPSYGPLGSVLIENAKGVQPHAVGEIAYVAATDGFVAVDVSVPTDPAVVAEHRGLLGDREPGPLPAIHDLAVEGDRLAVAGPAIAQVDAGLRGFVLYDVSDPANPTRVAFHETAAPIRNCVLRDGVVYLTGNDGDRNPLVMVDVRDDAPEEVGRWSLVDVDDRWGKAASPLRMLHDVWVHRDRAYLAHWDAGTWILDVSDPAAPTALGRVGGRPVGELVAVEETDVRLRYFTLPGNSHYAMPDEDAALLAVGKQAWEWQGEGKPGGVDLWDVADLANPRYLATIDAPPTPDPTVAGTWTTAHDFDVVGDRLYTSWYQGGVKVHDVSDPANPAQVAWWHDPERTSFWTAQRASSDFFVATSGGRRGAARPALYTFPNPAGR